MTYKDIKKHYSKKTTDSTSRLLFFIHLAL
nr:MAG TPA: hypothetical protein [Caudoviricetes sp.]